MDPLNLLLFIVALSVLMFVHELGHYITARRAGIVVQEFGFGLPPRMVGIERNGVIYSLNWIPFGAFVRMLGEEDPSAPGSFASKGKLTRAIVLAAGSGMNFLAAGIVFAAAFMTGWPTPVLNEVLIGAVADGSPAQAAGLQAGDIVTAFNGTPVTSVREFQDLTKTRLGEPIQLQYRRNGQTQTTALTPRENPPEGQGAIGVRLDLPVTTVSYNPLESLYRGFVHAGQVFGLTLMAPVMWARGVVSASDLRPIGLPGMAQLTSQAFDVSRESGVLWPVLSTIGTISAGLSFANLLPIPALDGGRLFFVIIEAIRGRRISPERESLVHFIGIVVLIALMILISVNDIQNPFGNPFSGISINGR
ncbi:MAG: site-2 protease family protein [Chloroflexi bacterium]|nr:site-2 protease family protein [Chloroflexota bacterium]